MPPKKGTVKATGSKRKRADEEEENEGEENSDVENESGDSDNDSNNSNSDSDNDDDDDDDENDSNDSDNDSAGSNSDKDEDDEPPKKKGGKAAPKAKKETKKVGKKDTKKTAKKAVKKEKKSSSSKDAKEKKVSKAKSLRKSERLEEARKAYKWWEAPKLANGVNWLSMEHAGICFAAPYVPHNVPLFYNGKPVTLTSEQEEIASFFAAIPADGPQLGNAKTKPVFEKNFFDDFKEALGPGHEIKKFELCDFRKIKDHLDNQKNLRKTATDEEKALRKIEKEAVLLQYGYALIDGRVEKVRVESPFCWHPCITSSSLISFPQLYADGQLQYGASRSVPRTR